MPMFETLLELDNQLFDWLIHACPTTEEERQKMTAVFIKRGELDQKINALVAFRLQLAVAPLGKDMEWLADATTEMRQVAKNIASVERVLSVAGTGVTVAAKALSLVTAV